MTPEVERGLDRDLADKAAAKYDTTREMQVREWIDAVLNEPGLCTIGNTTFHDLLKDGQILCRVMNTIQPASHPPLKINKSGMPFKQMENISAFLLAAERLKCPKHDVFNTVDLYEAKNLGQVIDTLFSVARHAAALGYQAPRELGPKLAEKHQVQFTQEQLLAGKYVPSQQMGFVGGANQSGMAFGARREIDAKTGSGATDVVVQHTAGFNGGANQSGMTFGARREIDSKTGTGATDVVVQHTAGFNGGANQSGMTFGARREIR